MNNDELIKINDLLMFELLSFMTLKYISIGIIIKLIFSITMLIWRYPKLNNSIVEDKRHIAPSIIVIKERGLDRMF